jgi:hypothetical protein
MDPQKTQPVFTLVLFSGLVGLAVTVIGIAFDRDLLALGGLFLVAACLHAIVRLVK